ncbi:EpsG family protein [Anaerostipes faecalis]|uniref:EpsG family protein n=1 Tax=Anaerostipes faecalis TaxID=2738446 RepID=UPI001C1E4FB5|nr:EpsG family protein [Anaerostipes faecalis]
MSSYILIILWIGIAPLLLSNANTQEAIQVQGKIEYRYKLLWAFLIFLPIIIMAGTRGDFADTAVYRQNFINMPQSFSGLPHYIASLTKDKGFYILSAILRVIIGNHDVAYFMILAFIQGICLLFAYRKYSCNYVISVFLFLSSSDYISWMYNGIRQFTAVAITFACIGLILEDKKIKFIIFVLIASTMHQSALLLIPFIFIVKGDAWNKRTVLFIIAILLAIAFIGKFTSILDSGLADTQYKNVVSDWQEAQDDGTNVLRVLVYAVPTVLSYIGRKIIWEENDSLINLCVNMSIISTGFYVISMFTSGIFIGRIPIYFSLYNYILLPWEIEHLFTEKSQKIVYLGLIGFYLLFYYYQMHLTWGLI